MRGWVLWLLLAMCAGWPAGGNAQTDGTLIVGRADADASGDWPVALWVVDGGRSRFIVRAPRRQLGRQPWRPADAQALMQLERFGAPPLLQSMDTYPCPSDLRWGQVVSIPEAHEPGEREALAHSACGARDCGGAAWQVALPDAGDALPLGQLLPGVAADQPEWLVLYVVSRLEYPLPRGVAQLRVADALRGERSLAQWSQFRLPMAAAASFPAIHTALLERAAQDQGLAQASVLMRADLVSLVRPPRLIRGWESSEAQRRALGVAGDAVQGHSIMRLLFRLMPADRPRVLQLEGVPWQTAERVDRLSALTPWPETPASCRRRLSAMNCQAACERRVAAMAQEPGGSFYADASINSLTPAQRLPACVKVCESRGAPSDAELQRRFDAIEERQRQAWRWVEQMTGRPADSWQAP